MSSEGYLWTSECVGAGHPDKVADQISDAVLDAYLEEDKDSKVACETMIAPGLIVVAGEVRSNLKRLDVESANIYGQHEFLKACKDMGIVKDL